MSSIFAIISPINVNQNDIKSLADTATNRGRNWGGVLYINEKNQYTGHSINANISNLIHHSSLARKLFIGFTGISNNYGGGSTFSLINDSFVTTDSLILNKSEIFLDSNIKNAEISDAEFIAYWFDLLLQSGLELSACAQKMLHDVSGILSAFIILPRYGKMVAFSNTSGLYLGKKDNQTVIGSEERFLVTLGATEITQIKDPIILDIPKSDSIAPIVQHHNQSPTFRIYKTGKAEQNFDNDLSLLKYHIHNIKRCTRCILPETMPFISFDEKGVCNYCHHHQPAIAKKSKAELLEVISPYRKSTGYDCVVPFSGGRDSCYALHIIVNELKLKPITYTYDWGMVTNVGQRNISKMSQKLGIENVIVAADVEKKRKNLSMNLKAWLKKPNLGMLNILTAGDKHFFQHVEDVKKDNNIKLNLWGVNPLEVTHFKTGFLGIEPNFALQGVYARGIMKQLRYQSKRLRAMIQNPLYFNSSLIDTLSGEYYRSFTKKEDYFHMFDYWQWDEDEMHSILSQYEWEYAEDTACSWRIGDGVAGLYNYIYYTVAGFTEHDTFRSNQVREGMLTREEALKLVEQENSPRYENLQWFFKTLNMDFNDSIQIINNIPKLYSQE